MVSSPEHHLPLCIPSRANLRTSLARGESGLKYDEVMNKSSKPGLAQADNRLISRGPCVWTCDHH